MPKLKAAFSSFIRLSQPTFKGEGELCLTRLEKVYDVMNCTDEPKHSMLLNAKSANHSMQVFCCLQYQKKTELMKLAEVSKNMVSMEPNI